jgi:hypothetical protein
VFIYCCSRVAGNTLGIFIGHFDGLSEHVASTGGEVIWTFRVNKSSARGGSIFANYFYTMSEVFSAIVFLLFCLYNVTIFVGHKS